MASPDESSGQSESSRSGPDLPLAHQIALTENILQSSRGQIAIIWLASRNHQANKMIALGLQEASRCFHLAIVMLAGLHLANSLLAKCMQCVCKKRSLPSAWISWFHSGSHHRYSAWVDAEARPLLVPRIARCEAHIRSVSAAADVTPLPCQGGIHACCSRPEALIDRIICIATGDHHLRR